MVKALIAGLLVSAAYEPIGIWFLAILGFALFLRSLRTSSRPILSSFIFGLSLNAVVLHWSGSYVGVLPWLLLATLQAVFYLPVGLVYRRSKNVFFTCVTLLVFEELRSRFPFGGFGWTRIAFSQVESPALPLVAFGGVLALSAFTLAIAALFSRFSIRNFSGIFLLFVLALLLPSNPQGSGSVNLLAVQGNTPEVGLGFNSRAKAVFYLHRDATREFATGSYDAIIWPENAIDIDPRLYPEVAQDISALTRDLQTPLIAGVVQRKNGSPQNASIMYGKDGSISSSYIKRGLTPFGEYIPLRKLTEIVSPLARDVNDFIPGNNQEIHNVSGARLGPVICYELIIDDLVKEMASNSQALIVHTNSATFANTAESAQQLAITRIRAVQFSRSIVSVSTVGISAFIDNTGRVVSQTPENVKTYLEGTLELNTHETFASRLPL